MNKEEGVVFIPTVYSGIDTSSQIIYFEVDYPTLKWLLIKSA